MGRDITASYTKRTLQIASSVLLNFIINFIINLSYTDFSKKVTLYRKLIINRNLIEKCCCLKPWPTLHLINHFLFTAGKNVHIRSYQGRADML